MATEVEKSVEYLIELGEKQGLSMNKILKKTSRTGAGKQPKRSGKKQKEEQKTCNY